MTPEPPIRREPQVRTDFSPSEARWAIAWLSIGAMIAVLLQVTSINAAWGIPSIATAFLFQGVVTRTGRLWTSKSVRVLVPTLVWAACFAMLYFGVDVTSDILNNNSIRALALLTAGCLGGVWPLLRRK